MRIRATPFAPQVTEFIHQHNRNYVVELNQDGQLRQLLSLAVSDSTCLISTAHGDGMPLSARWIVSKIMALEEVKQ
jgi:2-oxoglutarate ferredoxin oxidoreductase subunit alpha